MYPLLVIPYKIIWPIIEIWLNKWMNKKKGEKKEILQTQRLYAKIRNDQNCLKFWQSQSGIAVYTMLFKGEHFSSKCSRNECKYFTQGCLRLSFLTKREKFTEICKQIARGDKKTRSHIPSSECNFSARPAGVSGKFAWCQACWCLLSWSWNKGLTQRCLYNHPAGWQIPTLTPK